MAMLLLSLLLLCGCGDEIDVPDEMQLVGGGAEDGYYFFAPEEWTVSNIGEVDAVYVSRVDTSSVTFVKVDPASFAKPDPTVSDEDFFFGSYFELSKSEFPSDTEFFTNAEATLLGSGETKADRAIKYTYSYTYAEHKFGFMQILASHGTSFYILTYSAPMEERSEGVTNYDFYLEKLGQVIDNFRFVDAVEGTPKEEPVSDEDGDVLISDPKLCGFSLSVPSGFERDFASAIVSASAEDGSNITMTKTTAGGMKVNEYFELRKTELSKIVGEITVVNTVNKTALGNSENAAAYEYTYEYGGKSFHVYQIFAVVGRSGYVFTYTAREDSYAKHFEDVTRIIGKVVF